MHAYSRHLADSSLITEKPQHSGVYEDRNLDRNSTLTVSDPFGFNAKYFFFSFIFSLMQED